jgi:uncharacterized protein (DUF1499 family)
MWIAAVVVGLSVLGWALTMVLLSVTAVRPADLGPRDGRLKVCPGTPNCVCSFDQGDAAIEPLTFDGDAAEAWGRLKAVLKERPQTMIVSETDGYMHVECTSLLFRFVDDVEFLLDAAGRKIHFRSKSRAGRSDLGVNRARMEAIRAAFAR